MRKQLKPVRKPTIHNWDSFGGGSKICFSGQITVRAECQQDEHPYLPDSEVLSSEYSFFWNEDREPILQAVRHALDTQLYKEVGFVVIEDMCDKDFREVSEQDFTLWVSGAFTFEGGKWVLTDVFALGMCQELEDIDEPYDE